VAAQAILEMLAILVMAEMAAAVDEVEQVFLGRVLVFVMLIFRK
jgi:hypothetical protein